MKLRLAVAAVLAVCGALLLGPGSAMAQSGTTATNVSSFNNIPVTGTTTGKHKQQFHGTFTVERFVNRNGSVLASGELKGKAGKKSVNRKGVLIPISVNHSAARSAASCPILNLTLGPVDLNLLGLRIQLNQVHLVITAIQGPGNLLGNLLCSVANLLNQQGLPAGNLGGLLGILQQLLGTPSLLQL